MLKRGVAAALVAVLISGCGGGGGGTSTSAGASSGGGGSSSSVVQTRTLTLTHSVTPRALPSSVLSLRLTGYDENNSVVYGPALLLFAPTLQVSVPLSLKRLQIEYLNAGGVFGRFDWTPNFDSQGNAVLSDPGWSDVTQPPVTPPKDPLPTADVAPSRDFPERAWGADRYLTFSTDRRLNKEDRDAHSDVYLRDILLGKLTAVTHGGNGESSQASVSADGRWVVFVSTADNLVPGDNNHQPDIFLWDRLSGKTVNITAAANGANSEPTISGDGSTVAFVTQATNLVAGDTDTEKDVVLYNREAATFALASANISGDANCPSLNTDGSKLGFQGKVDGHWQILVYERGTFTRIVASRSAGGAAGDGDSYFPSLVNGDSLLFSSQAQNLGATDSDLSRDIFRSTGGVVSKVLAVGEAPVASRAGLKFVARKAGDVVLADGTGGATVVASGEAGAISKSYLALFTEGEVKAENPARGELLRMNSSYLPVTKPSGGGTYQDLGFDSTDHLLVADFKEDGNLDLIGLAKNSGAIRSLVIAYGNVTGGFERHDFDLHSVASGMAKGFFDGDSHQDFVVITQDCTEFPYSLAAPVLKTYSGDGAGGFTLTHEFSTPAHKWPLVGHFNAGPELDVLLYSVASQPDVSARQNSQILFGNGDGSFVDSTLSVNLPEDLLQPVVGDFNDDGFDDIAAVDSVGKTLEVHLNNGDGTFAAPVSTTLSIPAGRFKEISVLNWNHQGGDDIAVTNYYNSDILLSDGDGTFTPLGSFPSGGGLPFAGGLDAIPGDDLFFAGKGLFYASGSGEPTLSISGDRVLYLGEFTGDSQPDQMVQLGTGVVMIPGLGGGRFGRPSSSTAIATLPAVGDFDGDLRPEMCDGKTLGRYQGLVSLNETTLSGQPSQDVMYRAAEDFNGDGALDLLVSGNFGYQVLLGDGTGDFTPLDTVTAQGFSEPPRLRDLDRDGMVDVVAPSGSELRFFRGQGDGSFAAPSVLLTAPNSVHSLADVRDFTGDGKDDLVAGTRTTDPVLAVSSGLGGVSFDSPVYSPQIAGGVPRLFDVDGDGLSDICYVGVYLFVSAWDSQCGTFPPTRYKQLTPEFVENLGSGMFQAVPFEGVIDEYAALSDVVDVDYNDDGLTDLLLLDSVGTLVNLTGDGSKFTGDSRNFFTGRSVNLVKQDFDLDGKDEILGLGSGVVVKLP